MPCQSHHHLHTIGFVQTLQHCFRELSKTVKHTILRFSRTQIMHFQWLPVAIFVHIPFLQQRKQFITTQKLLVAPQLPVNVLKLRTCLIPRAMQLISLNSDQSHWITALRQIPGLQHPISRTKAFFRNFPGLQIISLKLYDFPGSVWAICIVKQWSDMTRQTHHSVVPTDQPADDGLLQLHSADNNAVTCNPIFENLKTNLRKTCEKSDLGKT